MTFLPNLKNSYLEGTNLNKAQMYLLRGQISAGHGYVLGLADSTTVPVVSMLFPYSQNLLGNVHQVRQKQVSSNRLCKTNKLPFTKFTQFCTDEPLIDPLYEDFIVITDFNTMAKAILRLDNKYKHMHTLLVSDESTAKYKLQPKSKLTLLMARGEDVYPGEVLSENSVALLVHDGTMPLFYITFSDNKHMFSFDCIEPPSTIGDTNGLNMLEIQRRLKMCDGYIKKYNKGAELPDPNLHKKIQTIKVSGKPGTFEHLFEWDEAIPLYPIIDEAIPYKAIINDAGFEAEHQVVHNINGHNYVVFPEADNNAFQINYGEAGWNVIPKAGNGNGDGNENG